LHLYSENELTDTQSTNLGSADANGSGSINIHSEDKTVAIALRRTLACVAAAVVFGSVLAVTVGSSTSEEFFAGYLLELSLSVDNLLVFVLLFEYFQIPSENQNRVLNYGIIGAVVMRAIMIGAGAVAIEQFHVVLLGFAGILIFSSAKVLLGSDDEEEEDLSDNFIVKFSTKFMKSTSEFDGDRFFTVQNGIRLATPMLLCTVAVELSDVVFAVDSIPAVFGVTEVRRYMIWLNIRRLAFAVLTISFFRIHW
jgi:TerC family integral membrane protein